MPAWQCNAQEYRLGGFAQPFTKAPPPMRNFLIHAPSVGLGVKGFREDQSRLQDDWTAMDGSISLHIIANSTTLTKANDLRRRNSRHSTHR